MRSTVLARTAAILALAIAGVAVFPAYGQEGPKPAGAPVKAELPKLEEVTKDMSAIPGLITFYRYDKDDATKDQTRVLALIPKGMLGADLMMANSVSRGSNFGYPLDDGVLVRFEQVGNRVLLMAPDTRLEEKGTIKDAVANTYQPAVLASFQILSSDKGLLVDLSPVLFSTISGVNVPPYGIRRENSRINKIKSFPENVLIDVDIATGQPGQPNTLTGVSYAFRKLPALGSYTPRKADERVGYFTTVRQDWNAKYSDHENLTRYINRWNVKKQDPSLELSPPEKPITFIIEKTVPIQFRKAVADGILEWNKAFEEIGITNAIVVQQQTDDNEFKDCDPEDARYNFIRWIVTGRGFAMGPSRPDPRTGQLLDADIIFDDSMVRFYVEDIDILGPKAAAAMLGDSMIEFYKDNPAYLPAGAALSPADQELLKASPQEIRMQGDVNGRERNPMPWAVNPAMHENRACSIGNGMRAQMAMARLAAAAGGAKKLPDRLIAEIVKDVVTHEVGHTLGLRHNFKGSAWKSIEEIKKARDEGGQAWASVMDYNPYLFFPGEKIEELKHIASSSIGPYDHWAIAYGYSSGDKGKSEEDTLAAIAAQNTKKENAYATDEDVMGLSSPDPTANRFDMGNDPVAWAQMRTQLADGLLGNLKDWAVKKDEPNYYLRDIFSSLMFERVRYDPFVAREITGQIQSRARPGDPDAPTAFTQIEPAKKREALKYLASTLFSEAYFNFSPETLNSLGVSRWMDWASTPAARTDYPVHSAVLSMQSGTLAALTSSASLTRVYDAERKSSAEDKFTAAELITSVRDAVWSDLDGNLRGTDAKPAIGSFRRNLQQQYLQNMLSLAELKQGASISPDLQNMVRFALRDLSVKIGKVSEHGGLDFATKAHLAEAKTRIDRVLDAPYIPPSNSGGGFFILMGDQTPAAGK